MYNLLHKYVPGDTVWVKNGNEIVECTVCRCTFEVDPSPEGITEEKVYHLDIVGDMTSAILLKPEEVVYESASDAISEIAPENPINSISYDFTVGDIVWTYHNLIDVEGAVKQITFYINVHYESVIYHLLDVDGEYSMLEQDSSVVYETQQDALDAIAEIITPTPTISITATATPTVTPVITQTVTPTGFITPTVTPNPTTTPVASGG